MPRENNTAAGQENNLYSRVTAAGWQGFHGRVGLQTYVPVYPMKVACSPELHCSLRKQPAVQRCSLSEQFMYQSLFHWPRLLQSSDLNLNSCLSYCLLSGLSFCLNRNLDLKLNLNLKLWLTTLLPCISVAETQHHSIMLPASCFTMGIALASR